MNSGLDKATLGGGCFWCVEAVFQDLRGVAQVKSGYAGGTLENPTYEQICSGMTGHAEVIEIDFEPAVITYEELLYIFWRTHDPTTLNRQGGDTGTQYRSVIFYHDDRQRQSAEHAKAVTEATDLWADPIVTQIEAVPKFYVAEAYHQNYYKMNPQQPYCRMVIDPKVNKLRTSFQEKLKH